MARKPIPGSDEGQWGDILNQYLDVVHDSTGALRSGAVTPQSLSTEVVTQIQTATQGPAGPQGPQGNPGPAGNDGSDGTDGVDGVGVPTGGSAGQVLAKASGSDHDTEWVEQTGSGGPVSWGDVTDKPATYAPSAHSHPISQVTNLQDQLDGKEEVGAVSTHEAETDPHATASYAIMLGGGRRIFVQSTDPGSEASDGDLWIDTSTQDL